MTHPKPLPYCCLDFYRALAQIFVIMATHLANTSKDGAYVVVKGSSMKKLAVRIAVLGIAVIPSVALVAHASAGAVPNNSGTNRASTFTTVTVLTDAEWTDPGLIGDGGRKLG